MLAVEPRSSPSDNLPKVVRDDHVLLSEHEPEDFPHPIGCKYC